jgi:hypothetical protein
MKTLLSALLISSLTFISTAKADVNVRVDALGALAGIANLHVDFGLGNAWSLGPSVQYINQSVDDFEANATSVGVRANYFFNGKIFTQGWYLGPSINWMSVKVEDNDPSLGKLEGSANGMAFTVLGGYQWMWESFNINLGIGPVYYTLGSIKAKSDRGFSEEFSGYDGMGISSEFTLGWKF